ncbi:hypothetical protein [Phycicoccus sp. DTK01]|uniref:hypothetical protein n=1 Tax=Phycicoccus sp. DTK01 TaxID=2785745 RepID=UPI001A8C31B3|nr:hypothetical protein [Phycicoccus sp. DTK01]
MILLVIAVLLVVAVVLASRGRRAGGASRLPQVLAGVVVLGVVVWVVVIAVQANGA